MSELKHKLKTLEQAVKEESWVLVRYELKNIMKELQLLKLSNLEAMSKLSMKAPDYHFYHGQNSLINKLDS